MVPTLTALNLQLPLLLYIFALSIWSLLDVQKAITDCGNLTASVRRPACCAGADFFSMQICSQAGSDCLWLADSLLLFALLFIKIYVRSLPRWVLTVSGGLMHPLSCYKVACCRGLLSRQPAHSQFFYAPSHVGGHSELLPVQEGRAEFVCKVNIHGSTISFACGRSIVCVCSVADD